MKYYHYSCNYIKKLERRAYFKNRIYHSPQYLIGIKPPGLWFTADDEHNWRDWCIEQQYNLQGLRYKYEITFFDEANILHIQTQQELIDFSIKYNDKKNVNLFMPLFFKRELETKIHWKRVARHYQGIIIAPFLGIEPSTTPLWYYGWDCSCGCVWAKKAIKKFTLISEEPYDKE